MARSRNIKPSIMENEDLADLAPIARLLFIYLWMLADREGRLEDRPKRIAGRALPYDREEDVDDLLNQLADAGFITRYTVGEQAIIQIDNFTKHQSPHVREAASELPGINQGNAKARAKHSLGNAEPSPRSPDSLLLIPDYLLPLPEKTYCSPSASESAKDGFADFWKAYPNKKAKPKAEAAWRKLKPSAQTIAELMAGLERSKVSEQWQRDGGQFIPYPATWLNGRRWEDQPPEGPSAAGNKSAADHKPKPGDTRSRFGALEVFSETMGWIPA